MYQRVDGQQTVDIGDRNGTVSPESFTRSLPQDYWGSLDTPEGEETSRLSFADTLEPLTNLPLTGDPIQQKFEATVELAPLEQVQNESNPWTPGFLARIPRLGFLAMVFNVMSMCTSAKIVSTDTI
jgi:hypothetical protein